jgi:hypothetical protein
MRELASSDHNRCVADHDGMEVDEVMQLMKDEVKLPGVKVRAVYTKHFIALNARNPAAAGRLRSLKNICRSLHRHQRAHLPATPATAVEFVNVINSDVEQVARYKSCTVGRFFQFAITLVMGSFAMFGTDADLEKLMDARWWFADGTFKCVPRGFVQLFTIHAESNGVLFPLIYVLMTSKSQQLYTAVSKVI